VIQNHDNNTADAEENPKRVILPNTSPKITIKNEFRMEKEQLSTWQFGDLK